MTDEPSTPPPQEPPRSAPVTITRSFGEMDGHIDQLHASIGDRVAKEKSVAFEIIMKWQEVEQIARNGWYERYGCETIFDYCARCYGYSESYVTRYRRIARLPASQFQGCIIPPEALRRAALHFKGPALDMLAACTKRAPDFAGSRH